MNMDSAPLAGSWWGGQQQDSRTHLLCVFAPFTIVGVFVQVLKSTVSICLPIHPSACIN